MSICICPYLITLYQCDARQQSRWISINLRCYCQGCRRGSQKMVRFVFVSKWRLRVGGLGTEAAVYREPDRQTRGVVEFTPDPVWRQSHKTGSWVETRDVQQVYCSGGGSVVLRIHKHCFSFHPHDSFVYTTESKWTIFLYCSFYNAVYISTTNVSFYSSGPTWKPSPLLLSTA